MGFTRHYQLRGARIPQPGSPLDPFFRPLPKEAAPYNSKSEFAKELAIYPTISALFACLWRVEVLEELSIQSLPVQVQAVQPEVYPDDQGMEVWPPESVSSPIRLWGWQCLTKRMHRI